MNLFIAYVLMMAVVIMICLIGLVCESIDLVKDLVRRNKRRRMRKL